jgi:von Willebrand factor type A domain/Putative Flp pilus-assembly TadE/G-like
VLFTLLLPTLMIPLAGLAIDASVARVVQIRLQAAVDGAVLGAGRVLGTAAIPETLAGEFLRANFRTDGAAGTWGANNLNYLVTYTPGITKRIDVQASAQAPMLFMRIFGRAAATVGASGSATRSDSRVVFVIDRSGSMNTDDKTSTSTMVITDAVNYTTGLVKRFIEGTDELGLVVFDGSAVVGYPSGTWTPTISLSSTGGPNKTFWDGSSTDMIHQLAAIHADQGTGMAEALSLAYIELQKAHMRDLNADGTDTRLNAIVLLTDGVPSAVSLYFNDPTNSNANNIVNGSSAGGSCNNKTIPTSNPAPSSSNMMQAWFALPGPTYVNQKGWGVYQLASKDTNASHTANWWMSFGGSSSAADAVAPSNSSAYSGCSSMTNNSGGNTLYTYFSKIPAADMYGNLLNTSGYTNSHVTGGSVTSIYNGTAFDATHPDQGYQWGLAIWNSVDNAAKNIRTDANQANRTGDTTGTMPIQIYVIGYTGNGGCDDGLLKRVANDRSAAGYDSTQTIGQYYSASDGAQLADAYNALASDLLRLSR